MGQGASRGQGEVGGGDGGGGGLEGAGSSGTAGEQRIQQEGAEEDGRTRGQRRRSSLSATLRRLKGRRGTAASKGKQQRTSEAGRNRDVRRPSAQPRGEDAAEKGLGRGRSQLGDADGRLEEVMQEGEADWGFLDSCNARAGIRPRRHTMSSGGDVGRRQISSSTTSRGFGRGSGRASHENNNHAMNNGGVRLRTNSSSIAEARNRAHSFSMKGLAQTLTARFDLPPPDTSTDRTNHRKQRKRSKGDDVFGSEVQWQQSDAYVPLEEASVFPQRPSSFYLFEQSPEPSNHSRSSTPLAQVSDATHSAAPSSHHHHHHHHHHHPSTTAQEVDCAPATITEDVGASSRSRRPAAENGVHDDGDNEGVSRKVRTGEDAANDHGDEDEGGATATAAAWLSEIDAVIAQQVSSTATGAKQAQEWEEEGEAGRRGDGIEEREKHEQGSLTTAAAVATRVEKGGDADLDSYFDNLLSDDVLAGAERAGRVPLDLTEALFELDAASNLCFDV